MTIPFVDLRPALRETEAGWRRHLAGLFERAHFILGEEVARFEAEFARESDARFAVGVGSGASAIELCLRAAGLAGSGKEVLTTPLTAPFTALAILSAGCKPRFADVHPESLLLDVQDAAKRMTKRTAAILPVHLYGQPCELDDFASLARATGAVLVQDACQAHAARCGERPFTAFSPFVAYSFYPTKNLGCLGDGGAILTDRPSVARSLRLLRDGGRSGGHVSRVPGVNSRLDEIQACFLRAFLPRLSEWNERRRHIAGIYEDRLGGCAGIRIVQQRPGSVYHLFVVRARRRSRLRDYLARHGIGTAVHYPVPLHLQPAFRDHGVKRYELPNAERACRDVLSLPVWPGMPDTAAYEVADRIRAFYASAPDAGRFIHKVTR